MIAARDLDRAFDGLGTGIGEEHSIGEGRRAESLGETLLLRDAMQIRHVPELLSLAGQSLDQMRMRVAEGGDGNPAREVEIAVARHRKEKSAFSPREAELAAGIGREEGRHES